MFYRRKELQLRIAFFFSATSLSGAFSGLLAAAIIKMDGVGGQAGWRSVLVYSQSTPHSDGTSPPDGSSILRASSYLQLLQRPWRPTDARLADRPLRRHQLLLPPLHPFLLPLPHIRTENSRRQTTRSRRARG